jgi:hypothetical protein
MSGWGTFPCACPPFSRPVGGLIACPARWPHYVIPCSHLLDPFYAQQLNPCFPFARPPRAFESESRAAGTGMIRGTAPCPPGPPPPSPWLAPGSVARTARQVLPTARR